MRINKEKTIALALNEGLTISIKALQQDYSLGNDGYVEIMDWAENTVYNELNYKVPTRFKVSIR